MSATTEEYRLGFFNDLLIRTLDPEGSSNLQGSSGNYFEYGLILFHTGIF